MITKPSRNRQTQGYGAKHRGYDFSGRGDLNCYACLDGTVIQSVNRYTNSWRSSPPLTTRDYGNYAKLRHSDGTFSLYAHLQKDKVPPVGKKFKEGQVIGIIGNTGNSTAAHLHFEFRNSNNINQAVKFKPPGGSMPSDDGALKACLKLHGELVDESVKKDKRIADLESRIENNKSDFEDKLKEVNKLLKEKSKNFVDLNKEFDDYQEKVAERLGVPLDKVFSELDRLISVEHDGKKALDTLRQKDLFHTKEKLELQGEIDKLKAQLSAKDLDEYDTKRLLNALINKVLHYLGRK